MDYVTPGNQNSQILYTQNAPSMTAYVTIEPTLMQEDSITLNIASFYYILGWIFTLIIH